MDRQTIQDANFRVIGYIMTMSDGRLMAQDAQLRTLGYYDPRTNITQDANLRILSRGNVLSGLIYR